MIIFECTWQGFLAATGLEDRVQIFALDVSVALSCLAFSPLVSVLGGPSEREPILPELDLFGADLHSVFGQDCGPLQHVLQFAHVARPLV